MVNIALEIFERSCPACQRTVPWSTRWLLISKSLIQCVHCKALLIINPRDRFVNLILIWIGFTIFNALYFQEPSLLREVFMLGLIMIFDLPKYLNVFFSLYQIVLPAQPKKNKRQKSL